MKSQNEGLRTVSLLLRIQKLGLNIEDINSQLTILTQKISQQKPTNTQRMAFYQKIIEEYENNNELRDSLWSKIPISFVTGKNIYEL